MAEEFYTVPESPEYNAGAIRKIQDTDPVRASTIVNPVVQQMITNTHAVKLQADQNTKAVSAAAGAAEDADEKATEALEAARNAAQVADQAGKDASNALIAADAALEAITKLAHTIDAVPTQNGSLTYTGSAQSPTWNSYNPETQPWVDRPPAPMQEVIPPPSRRWKATLGAMAPTPPKRSPGR